MRVSIGVAQTYMIKYLANPILTQRARMPLVVILVQSEGPSVFVEPTDRERVDTGISMDLRYMSRERHESRERPYR